MKLRLNIRGGISPERPEMYTFSHKFSLFWVSGVKVTLKLRGGILLLEKTLYILSYNLALSLWISRPKNLHVSAKLEWK